MTEIQHVAESPAKPEAKEPPGPPSFLGIVTCGVFVVGGLVWTGYFWFEYTIFNSGRWIHVAEGLIGLYYAALIAYGAARARPRPGRAGFFHGLLAFTLAQAVLFTVVWGSAWLHDPRTWLSYMFVGAFLAGPLVAIAYLFAARRSFFLVLGEIGGPAAFFLLWWLE